MKKFKVYILSVVSVLLLSFVGLPLEANAKTDEPSSRVILPNNDREQITNTTSAHYQSIAFADIGGTSIASGVVIGKNTVLTNKHVVDATNGDASVLKFSPAANGDGNYPAGTFTATDYTTAPDGEDLAVVTVGENSEGQSIGDAVQPATIADTSTVNKGDDITVTGYPGDKPIATLWESKGKILSASGSDVTYDLSTYGGNSGSPIFNASNQVIGLHYGGVPDSHNSGVLFNSSVQEFINSNLK
ncbi:trypsin-like serine peptidase [Mammaliicoccus vitulinus]|uniref:trypsin-like serine peptidase n=1 Tax=Mammaliicoccus vitulinus TaxID=71237 RepID=UPI00145A8EF4|nr:serine protease [Mammaliicoccus vitulinus]QJF25305.1 serine protease [Mammaliicoccus vitulinus]